MTPKQKENQKKKLVRLLIVFLFIILILVMSLILNHIIKRYKPVFKVGDCISLEGENSDNWKKSGYIEILEIGKESYRVRTFSKYLVYESHVDYWYNNIYKRINCPTPVL
jgi:alpha-N-acetylglucosamine transferase